MAASEFFMLKDSCLIISIMQPTFLPWLGYFNLIDKSEYFIFLDNVQFEPRSWQQRNRVLVNGQTTWITLPVSKPHGSATRINEVLINDEHFEPTKICETLRRAYSKRVGLRWLEQEIFPLIISANSRLSGLNETLIITISKALELSTEFIRASDLRTRGNKSELLESILLNFNEVEYLSPKSSEVYLKELEGKFPSGIPIQFQEFTHPVYEQGGSEFVPFLSIIDAIANVGLDRTRELIM